MDVAYWGEYERLMEAIRVGEKQVLARWGQGGRPHDGREIWAMQQLRLGLDALWVGFEE